MDKVSTRSPSPPLASLRTDPSDSVVVHTAKYTNIWKRDNAGGYRLTVDIFSRID